MSRSYQTLVRIALFAGLAVAWELLPRAGIVDAMLLPPLSDVLATLIKLLGQPNVHEALAVTAAEVIVAFLIAVPIGALIGVIAAENEYFGEIIRPLLF